MGFELSSEIVLSLTVLESWFPLRFVRGTTQNVIFHLGLIKSVTFFLFAQQLVHDALRERILTGNERIKVDALKKVATCLHIVLVGVFGLLITAAFNRINLCNSKQNLSFTW